MQINYETLINESSQAHILQKLKSGSKFYPVQISDLLRLLFLSQYGGAYMDSDTVSLMEFPSDISNFVIQGKHNQYDEYM